MRNPIAILTCLPALAGCMAPMTTAERPDAC